MKITLVIDGVEKEFSQGFISGRMLRKSLELQKGFETAEFGPEMVDSVADYVSEAFGRQFTTEQYLDGIDCSAVIGTAVDCILEITGRMSKASGVASPNLQKA